MNVPSFFFLGRLRFWFRKCQEKQVNGLCCVHLCWRNNVHCSTRNSFKYLERITFNNQCNERKFDERKQMFKNKVNKHLRTDNRANG